MFCKRPLLSCVASSKNGSRARKLLKKTKLCYSYVNELFKILCVYDEVQNIIDWSVRIGLRLVLIMTKTTH